MPNQLNKNKNKLKEKDEICSAQEILISKQRAERQQRLQLIADSERAQTEGETRQRRNLVEETREELFNLCTLKEENPNGRELTRITRSVEGARAWSELFVCDILLGQTLPEEDPIPLGNTAVENSADVVVSNSVGVAVLNSASFAVSNRAGVTPPNTTSVATPNTTHTQHPVIMVGTKEKVPKFDGDGTADPIRHYKTCKTIWMANGVTDTNEWV